MKSAMMVRICVSVAAVICCALLIGRLAAKEPQDGAGPGDPAGGAPADGGGKAKGKGKGFADPKALQSLRQQIEVTDPEWQALEGKIIKVQTLVKQLNDVRDPKKSMEPPKPPKGDAGADTGKAQPAPIPAIVAGLAELAERARDLRILWEDKSAHPTDIRAKLAAFRAARAKADQLIAAELAKAMTELRDLLTARQELVLVVNGLLD
jgi:hypothetical protein